MLSIDLDDLVELTRLYHDDPLHRVRERAHVIILLSRGYKVDALAALFQVNRDTISFWLKRWVLRKVNTSIRSAFLDGIKQGRPPKEQLDSPNQLLLPPIGKP